MSSVSPSNLYRNDLLFVDFLRVRMRVDSSPESFSLKVTTWAVAEDLLFMSSRSCCALSFTDGIFPSRQVVSLISCQSPTMDCAGREMVSPQQKNKKMK